ncbi:MAG: beta-galactosidase [Paenibacillaceae bacterium]|nr:beta-galactosidase [Paenibacillaceae bacterium]
MTLPVPDPHAWSPDDPYLYEFTVELADERGSGDAVAVRFGMREFTVSGKHFMLNGEKILLKAVFYEGLYPNTLAYPEDMELVRKEFRLAKEAGINMIRPWRKPQPTPIYELADEMGLLMVGAIPVECMRYWPRLTPYTERRVINEVEQMVQRDRNHASIVIWEMFNEIMRYSLKRIKHKVSLVARKLDPTRIIIDESGGFAGGAHVYLPGGTEPICFNDVHSYPGSPLNADGYDMFLSLGKTPEQMAEMNINQPMRSPSVIEPGLLTNITEIGYGSIPMLEDNVEQYEKTGNPLTPDYRYHRLLLSSYKKVLQSTGVDRIYPDFADFCRECQEIHAIGNKLMTEAARVNPDVSGIGIHAWTDGDWVFGAGLVDLFRNPKKAYYAAKEIFQPLYVAIRAKPSNVRDTDGANVSLTVVNDREPFRGELRVSVRDAAGGVKDERQLSVDVPNGIAKLAELRLDTNGWSGAYTIQAQLIEGDRESTKNEYGIYVLNANAESGAGCGTGSVADAAGATGATGKAGKSLPPIVACFPTESNANVRTFLAAQGCTVVAFDKSMSMDIPFLITRLPQNEAEREKIKPLQDWVGRGGQAIVHLKAPGAMRIDAAGLNVADVHEPDLFPFPVQLVRTRGLWSPANHIVKRHPIFDGLPQDCMMGQPYQNVYPQVSMLAPIGDWIVGFIGYHWYQGSKHRQNYTGIAPAFDAAELIAVPHGQGRYVLSTLRLPEQIGTDPLAKRILTNMLSWIVT